MDENISWKERHLQTRLAILPVAHRFVLRQKVFDTALGQLLRNAPFVVCACVRRIPERLGGWLDVTRDGNILPMNIGFRRKFNCSVHRWLLTASPRHLQGDM